MLRKADRLDWRTLAIGWTRASAMNYFLIGVLNLVTQVVLFWVLVRHMHHVLALVLCWLFGVGWTFVANGKLVANTFSLNASTTARYLILYVGSLMINILLLQLIVEVVGLAPFFSQLLVLPVIALCNYTLIRTWVFRDRRVKHGA